mmetsp:Transcript_51248/g.111400  ORF Transcript_51248/g.111400 Transcript_51248/m.111400 type:complete len:304 (+) Transcript_51248:251-1162(+)
MVEDAEPASNAAPAVKSDRNAEQVDAPQAVEAEPSPSAAEAHEGSEAAANAEETQEEQRPAADGSGEGPRASASDAEEKRNEEVTTQSGRAEPALAETRTAEAGSKEQRAAMTIQAAHHGKLVRREIKHANEEPEKPSIFTVRNLDTGEIVEIDMLSEQQLSAHRPAIPTGTLRANSDEWRALKADSKGLLEKLASAKTVSFRSYQLCVWQERYVYADDDSLCYQHLSADMQPAGDPKKIPYASIEFVGPFDDTQFVLKCRDRAYTFLCDSTATRTRWIKNISLLAGCSATTEVCHKTTTMGQ